MSRYYDNTLSINGLSFGWTTERDDGMREPWKEHDGHGVVSDWTRRGKAPGERELCEDRGIRRFYDVAATIKRARADGWGLGDDARDALAARLGREPTQREVTAAAVDADFDRLRRWCNDDWYWCGVIVELLDVDGEPTGERMSLWGVESDSPDYHAEVAHELAEQIADALGDDEFLPAKPAPDPVRIRGERGGAR